MGRRKIRNYAFEFLSIFTAVVFAFALNNWNENRKLRHSEAKILTEIRNGLQKDLEDIAVNMKGHNLGIDATKYWAAILGGAEVSQDSFALHYYALLRDYVCIFNNSGYESLKSIGLDIIENDSLRFDIITLYENDFKTIIKLEEEYEAMQFYKTYFHSINNIIMGKFPTTSNKAIAVQFPRNLAEEDLKKLNYYIWKIKYDREFIMVIYKNLETKIHTMIKLISEELEER